jgi:hypothetical protein
VSDTQESPTSGFKPYSLGIVVETKPRGTDYILVSPIEELNIQPQGSIKEYKKDFKGDQQDLESTSFKTEHESKNYIRAKWMPHSESNRTSAPDVVANETVMLYKFGDVDEYYWHDVMREPELRRLEDVLYSYSNQKAGQVPFDKETSYWIRYNTKDKYIHLHTSKNDGEPFIYDIKIDTKAGNIEIKDDVGNFIKFDSAADTLTGNFNKDINLKASNNINLDAGTNINLKAGSTINLEAPNIVEKCSSKLEQSSSSTSQCSGTKTTQASSIVNDTPMVTNTGSMSTAGGHTANPNYNAVH